MIFSPCGWFVSVFYQRIEELNRELKEQKEEYLEQTQQLRLSREQTQQAHVTITDMQRKLAQAQREKVSSESLDKSIGEQE